MSQRIKLLTVSDLHRDKTLIAQLARAVEKHKPDIVAVVGDFLDATRSLTNKFSVLETAAELSRLKAPEILFVRGNHEDSVLWYFADEFSATGKPFRLLEREVFVVGPLVIVGFPCLMGCLDNIADPISTQPQKWLPPLFSKHGPAATTIWLMHEPPFGTDLAKKEGVLSGNPEWMDVVERYSPSLVVFGHDHDTPIRKKRWHQQLSNNTLCVNLGQEANLRYSVVDFTFECNHPSRPAKIEITAYPLREHVVLTGRNRG